MERTKNVAGPVNGVGDIANPFGISHLYLGAILDKNDVWGAAASRQSVKPPSSLS